VLCLLSLALFFVSTRIINIDAIKGVGESLDPIQFPCIPIPVFYAVVTLGYFMPGLAGKEAILSLGTHSIGTSCSLREWKIRGLS